ncbi:MAG: serine hydrolase, partial [Rhodothermales bacterium]|nr:serine hydrolase [Rhodothermales bacterium]
VGLMTGHIRLSGNSYADSLPASLSHGITTGLLRDSLGFDGLIVTDALNMRGVLEGRTEKDVLVGAVAAGNDVLLMPSDPVEAVTTIVDAIARGDLSSERIRQSAMRILEAKARLDRSAESTARIDSVVRALDDPRADLEALTIARRSITLLGDRNALPIAGPPRDILMVSLDHRAGAAHGGDPLAVELTDAGIGPVVHRSFSTVNGADASPALIRNAAESDLIIVADHSAGTPVRGWNVARFLDRLATSTRPVIYVAFGSPYGIGPAVRRSAASLVAWESTDLASRAAADALLGRSRICGKLPIYVSDSLPRGAGECLDQSVPALSPPRMAGMEQSELDAIDDLVRSAIADSAFPAAALVVGRGRHIVKLTEYGSHTYNLEHPLSLDDRFDLASLTKVVATTTAVMRLYEQGLIELDRPVADYLPEFAAKGKGSVTIRDLLTHTGGLIPFRPFYALGVRTASEVRRRIMSDSLVYHPGADYRYSDFGPITLAWVIEEVTGRSFEEVLRAEVFEPLGMTDTGFRPSRRSEDLRFVPTELDGYFRNRLVRGEVHDENAWILGGVAGHAGLFSTPGDLARFASMMVSSGRIAGRQFLKPETIRLFTAAVDSLGLHTRALGWDTRSPVGYSSAGQHFGSRSFGHTGFTGTSIWMDPDQNLYVILLTNRVHPSRNSRGHISVRPAVADRVFDAIVSPGE